MHPIVSGEKLIACSSNWRETY